MNNSPYVCSLCKRRFGRRYNAQRHNFTHFNQGEIHDRFDNLIINLPLPQSKISVLRENGMKGVIQVGLKNQIKTTTMTKLLTFHQLKTQLIGEPKAKMMFMMRQWKN